MKEQNMTSDKERLAALNALKASAYGAWDEYNNIPDDENLKKVRALKRAEIESETYHRSVDDVLQALNEAVAEIARLKERRRQLYRSNVHHEEQLAAKDKLLVMAREACEKADELLSPFEENGLLGDQALNSVRAFLTALTEGKDA